MGLFDGLNLSSHKKKENDKNKQTVKAVTARWEVSLSVVCPICETKIDMDKPEMKSIGIKRLLESPKKLTKNHIECPMCNLPIMIKNIQEKPKLRGEMALDTDYELYDEDTTEELDLDNTSLDDIFDGDRPEMGYGDDDEWDYQ